MTPSPTPSERRLLELLQSEEDGGARPTYREIAAALGWRAVGTVRDHVRALARKGLVVPPGGRARSLRLTALGRRAIEDTASSLGGGDAALARLGGPDSEALAALRPYVERRSYPPGQVLWREGETAGRLVVITGGHVRAFRTQESGRLVPLYVFGAGEVFGFLPFLDGGVYPAGAETVDAVEALVVSRAALERAVRADAQVALLMLAALARRLRGAFDRIEELSMRGALPRVAAALAALLPERTRAGGLTVVTLPAPARELAESLGISPETFSRAVTQLAERGVVHRLGARRLQILDAAALRRSARRTPL